MDIFISYSWENKSISDKLDVLFKSNGIVPKRDIRDINYRKSIKEYMKKIRKSDYCLMIISDSFLKSKNCMYEVLEFIKDENYKNRILPILCDDTKIFNASDRAIYIKFWQDDYEKFDNLRESINPLNQEDILNELKIIENIQRNISEFLSNISDMQLVIVNNDISLKQYLEIFNIIKPSEKYVNKDIDNEGYFITNIPRTINEKIFKWWQVKSAGYINDIREAKIFTKNEIIDFFEKSEYPIWENKKFTGIPINIILSMESNIIPFTHEFIISIQKNKDLIYGNKQLYLNKEELEEYM
jgi:hypothetical protein